MKTDPITLERSFDLPASTIWAALTDNNELKKWYFPLPNFEARVGFKFDFMAGSEGKRYLHLCEVTEVEEGKKLAYSWRYDSYPGNSLVCWELLEKEGRTIVKLSHEGVHTFEEAGKDFAKSSFQGGWNYFLHEALKGHLESMGQ